MKLYRLFTLGLLISGLQALPAELRSVAGDTGATTNAPAKKAATESRKKSTESEKAATTEAKKKRQWYPFHGFVESVNPTASMVTLHKIEGQRVLRLDGKSTLTRNGKAATLGDLKPGDYAHGKLHKNTRDEEVITDGKFDTEPPKKEAKKAVKDEAKEEKKASAKKTKDPNAK